MTDDLKTCRRNVLRPIIKEVFQKKGIVLSEADQRWLVQVAEEKWLEYLKTIK